MHTISIFVDQNRMPEPASYFECQTHLAKNLRNSANFILRNLRTGLKKDPDKRTANENEVIMVLVYKCRQKKLNKLYYKKKEQRRCSIWRKIKRSTHKSLSNKLWICTIQEITHFLSYQVNMA